MKDTEMKNTNDTAGKLKAMSRNSYASGRIRSIVAPVMTARRRRNQGDDDMSDAITIQDWHDHPNAVLSDYGLGRCSVSGCEAGDMLTHPDWPEGTWILLNLQDCAGDGLVVCLVYAGDVVVLETHDLYEAARSSCEAGRMPDHDHDWDSPEAHDAGWSSALVRGVRAALLGHDTVYTVLHADEVCCTLLPEDGYSPAGTHPGVSPEEEALGFCCRLGGPLGGGASANAVWVDA